MEWKEVTLGEISSKIGDGLHGTPKYDDEGPYYFINGNNLNCGKIIIKDDTKRVGKDEFVKNQKELNERTILVSINGTIGNVAKYNNELCILGKSACYINVIKDVDKEFIYYVLTSANFKRNITNEATGTTIKNVSLKQMREYKFNIPCNISDQRRIASILSSLDRKIELNNKINADLEEMAQAIFKNWFVDFEPFKNGKFVDSELGMIPEGWKVISLSEIMKYNGGSQPPASEFIDTYQEGYIRFIQIRDYDNDSHITYIPISKRNKLCDELDIMIARYGAALGRICWGLKGAYNVALAKVTPLKSYYREYLRCYLNTSYFYQSINNKGARCAQSGFNQSDINSYMIAFPIDETVVMNFNDLCSSIMDKRLSLKYESSRLSLLRDTLLPRLMSGEIEIPE